MRYLTVLVAFVFCATIMNCDGRKSKNEALKESNEKFNNSQFQTAKITYLPKEYVEVVTDTLIGNSMKIRIKNYTRMDDAILIDSKENHKNYHRKFATRIRVESATKVIFETVVDTDSFDDDDGLFWKTATLEHAWVNQELSSSDEAHIDIGFTNPLNHQYKLYRMVVNRDGAYNYQLIEESS